MSLCVPGRKSKVLEKKEMDKLGWRRREMEEGNRKRDELIVKRRKEWFWKWISTKK